MKRRWWASTASSTAAPSCGVRLFGLGTLVMRPVLRWC